MMQSMVLFHVFEHRTNLLQFNIACLQFGLENRFVWKPIRGWHLMDCYRDDERCICDYALWYPYQFLYQSANTTNPFRQKQLHQIPTAPPQVVTLQQQQQKMEPNSVNLNSNVDYDNNFYEYENDISPIPVDWTGNGKFENEDSFRDFRKLVQTDDKLMINTLNSRLLDYQQKTKVLNFRWFVEKCHVDSMIYVVRNVKLQQFHLTDCPCSILKPRKQQQQQEQRQNIGLKCHCDYALKNPYNYLFEKYNIREPYGQVFEIKPPNNYPKKCFPRIENYIVVALTLDGFAWIDPSGRRSYGQWPENRFWRGVLKEQFETQDKHHKKTRIYVVPDNFTYRKMKNYFKNDDSFLVLPKDCVLKPCLVCRRLNCYGTMAQVLFNEILGNEMDNYSWCSTFNVTPSSSCKMESFSTLV